MERLVRMNSDIQFIGQSNLQNQAGKPLSRRLACFTTQDETITLHGRETIYRNNQRVGWTSSAGWAYTIGKNVAYGYVRNENGVTDDYLSSGEYEIEVEHSRFSVNIENECLYDPKSLRMRL